jgi:DNA-binding transcriptional regulator PaaX
MDALFEESLAKVEGGEETLAAMRREIAEERWETEAARNMREEELLMALERTGEVRRGTGELSASFWDLPMPEDPSDSVRRALEEDRN